MRTPELPLHRAERHQILQRLLQESARSRVALQLHAHGLSLEKLTLDGTRLRDRAQATVLETHHAIALLRQTRIVRRDDCRQPELRVHLT